MIHLSSLATVISFEKKMNEIKYDISGEHAG
jgi:hypothetical protein